MKKKYTVYNVDFFISLSFCCTDVAYNKNQRKNGGPCAPKRNIFDLIQKIDYFRLIFCIFFTMVCFIYVFR